VSVSRRHLIDFHLRTVQLASSSKSNITPSSAGKEALAHRTLAVLISPALTDADLQTSLALASRECAPCADAFRWKNGTDGTLTPSSAEFRLHVDEDLVFHKGKINLRVIVGPTGSGGTSMLMALLGEMHFISAGPGGWFNPRGREVSPMLPKSCGCRMRLFVCFFLSLSLLVTSSYSIRRTMSSLVRRMTLRATRRACTIHTADLAHPHNSLVIYQCALERDLELFEASDQTEVASGEKGLTLR
jgi:hypothetical protein